MKRDSLEKTISKVRRRLDERKLQYKDGGPGSGNWGHEGRKGEIGGSAKGGGAGNREFRDKVGFISKMKQGDEKICSRADAKAKKMKAKMPEIIAKNHKSWLSCKEAHDSGRPIPSASEAAKDCVLRNSTEGAQAAYDKAMKNEKVITSDMVEIATASGTEMYGLDYSVKTAESVMDKVARSQAKDIADGKEPRSDESIISGMHDIVRYTQLCEHDKTAETAKKTMSMLKERGYNITWVGNRWTDSDTSYNGFHLTATSPTGQEFELQIHSKESMVIKEQNHVMYEPARKSNASAYVRDTLHEKMMELTSTLKPPKGIDDPELRSW